MNAAHTKWELTSIISVAINSFTANVADRRLGPPPLTLLKPLYLQTLCSAQSILDFDISNLGYLLNVIERKGRNNKNLEKL